MNSNIPALATDILHGALGSTDNALLRANADGTAQNSPVTISDIASITALGGGDNSLSFGKDSSNNFGASWYNAAGTLICGISSGGSAYNDVLCIAKGKVGFKTQTPETTLQVGDLGWTTTDNAKLTIGCSSSDTGALQFGDAIATPAQGFVKYDHSTDSLSIGANASTVAVFKSGNVGIGTTSVTSKIHVLSSAEDTWTAQIFNTAATTGKSYGLAIAAGTNATDTALYVYDKSNTVPFLLVKGNGNVGIGTTTPIVPLMVKNQSGVTGNILGCTNDYVANTSGSGYNFIFGAASGDTYTHLQAWKTGALYYANLILNGSGGNVGIGTTSPSYPLSVENNVSNYGILCDYATFRNDPYGPNMLYRHSRNATSGAHTVVSNGDTLGSFVFQGSDGSAWKDAAYLFVKVDGVPGSNDMPARFEFCTSADGSASPTERMRIGNTGNVGIGCTPGYKLEVEESGSNWTMAIHNHTSTGHGLDIRAGNSSTTYPLYIYNYDNSKSLLYIRGDGYLYLPQYADGSLSISSGAVVSSSDARLKTATNEKAYGLDTVMNMIPRRFKWTTDNRDDYGFFAQDFLSVLPEAVGKPNMDGGMYGLFDRPIIAALVKAVQELKLEIDGIKQKV